ncbi:hypothetical protein [Bradyrhizobium sp. CCGUVB23]|uniref:hypothetical protein n=1 Tax=Bradyrhizobium sp. CCGUVB23 TaxID=2949630 RepID=UPI0020B3D57E|nr:hypothetical protein [Bradyrhizobium sp. CCGUVB23]MCP3459180.1 hypothetical protein [Bradyrhizobium sp. CCGUVB23]
MPRRVKPACRLTSMVRLDGYGQEDDRPLDLIFRSVAGLKDRGRQGCLLSDVQYNDLIETAELKDPDDEARPDLNYFRLHVLKDCLHADQQPSRQQIHKEVTKTCDLVRDFLQRLASIGPLPHELTNIVCIEPLGPADVFSAFPKRLYDFAALSRYHAKTSPRPSKLDDAAASADRLARHLKYLDAAASEKILDALWLENVRGMRDLAAIAGVVLDAAICALKRSKKIGGPRPKTIIKEVVIWLGDWFERYGGEFTHTPRAKGEYDGRLHTAAARFVFRFLTMCDCSITETAVSQFMAEAIKFRRQRGRQAGETSS